LVNIPVDTIKALKKVRLVFPDANVLEISQHRLSEKQFLNNCFIPTAKWAPALKPEDIDVTLQKWGVKSCIIKTTRLGYDGKGQIKFKLGDDAKAAWQALKSKENIIEEIIDFMEQTGEKCVILHKERGAFVILKAEEYKNLVKDRQKKQERESLTGPETDVRLYEIPRINQEEDIYYPEPLE